MRGHRVFAALYDSMLRRTERAGLGEMRAELLAEAAGRTLEFLCVEHVRDPRNAGLARWQDRLERPWGWIAGGCHPNRDTVAALEAAGLEGHALRRDALPSVPPIVRPMIRGRVARRR